ncbi:MAG: hypothetical protein ACW98F_18340 [Candidatus Hodarchaeales archaeon]
MITNIKVIDFLSNVTNMHQSSFKPTYTVKWAVFVLLFSFWINTTIVTNAATTAGWGDVVDVHYLRYATSDYSGTPAEDNVLESVYLSIESTVPPEIIAVVPDANAGFVTTFKEGIVGATVNVEKQFVAVNAYGDGVDLYFVVTVLEILYDASGGDPDTSVDTSSTPSDNNPFKDIGNVIIFGGGGGIIVVGLLSWAVMSSRRRGQILSSSNTSVSRREESIKQSKTKLKELRELAESRGSDLPEKESEESTDVKFRRRR